MEIPHLKAPENHPCLMKISMHSIEYVFAKKASYLLLGEPPTTRKRNCDGWGNLIGSPERRRDTEVQISCSMNYNGEKMTFDNNLYYLSKNESNNVHNSNSPCPGGNVDKGYIIYIIYTMCRRV